MRVILRAATVALALVAGVAGSASAQSRLAFIRSSVLLEQAPGRADAEAQFDRETAGFREQIKRMSDSLNAMVGTFEKSQAGMAAAARDARGKEIRAREDGYRRRTQELEQKAQQRQGELVQPILDRIKQAIEDTRVEGGYAFVFNADQQGGAIVAMDKNLDITDRVIAKLRTTMATTPGSRPATTATPAPSGVTRPATPPTN